MSSLWLTFFLYSVYNCPCVYHLRLQSVTSKQVTGMTLRTFLLTWEILPSESCTRMKTLSSPPGPLVTLNGPGMFNDGLHREAVALTP